MTNAEALRDRLTTEFGDGARWMSADGADALAWTLDGFDLLWRGGGTETQLRNSWNERKDRGPRPLVLLAPMSDAAKCRVCGPQQPRPIHQLPIAPVLHVLRETAALHFNEAAQTLSREFARLEDAAVPGLRVKELLTPHFVRERLRPRRSQLDETISEVTSADARAWSPLVRKLGYSAERLPRRGYLLRDADDPHGAPIAVVHPSNDPDAFGQLTVDGALPEGRLLADCERHGAAWGVLAAGGRYRLFQRRPESGAAGGRYLEIDANDITRDSRFCLGLLSPPSLREHGWLEGWAREARDFGEELRKGLEDRLIRDVLPEIARGLGEHLESEGVDPGAPEQLERIGEAALTLVFRFMFLLHVEARGFLPVNSPVYSRRSATSLARECHDALVSGPADRNSTRIWNDLSTLVGMIRKGDSDAGVPAYNGQLFAAEGFPGSELLETAEISNARLAPALDAIAYDTARADAPGLDYAGLQVGHLGAIYEALLSMKLSSAPEDLIYDAKRKVYRPARAGETSEVTRRDLFYQSEAGDRKAGGVFYTREEFVRHLLKHSLEPELDEHLRRVRETLDHDRDAAARMLFDFSVLDPAMGSAHFLTVALDVMADRYVQFFAEVDGFPGIAEQLSELRRDDLPGVRPPEDGDLLRRLILKRCIYGVDIQPMAVEVANITLWLASFVPGLALSWLDGNLKCGNSLVGVADSSVVERSGDQGFMFSDPVREAMDAAAAKHHELSGILDQTPDDVRRSREVAAELSEITSGLRTVFDLWAAEPLGLDGARRIDPTAVIGERQLSVQNRQQVASSQQFAEQHQFLHWPLEFPSIFHRDRPGFDVVVGNPPWEEVTIEELAFYALRDPGLRGITDGRERARQIAELKEEHPDWREQLASQQERLKVARQFFTQEGGYQLQGVGDTDLYQLFCERYTHLVREGGRLGVVLPRSAFMTKGNEKFRHWLFERNELRRFDVLLNNKHWAFPIHPQWTIALLAIERVKRDSASTFQTTGPSASLVDFMTSADSDGVTVQSDSLGNSRIIQLLPTQRHADILAKLRQGVEFGEIQNPENAISAIAPSAASHVTPYRELDATQQKEQFEHPPGNGRVPVWRGRSFDQYDPHGRKPAGYADWQTTFGWLQEKRTRALVFKRMFRQEILRDPSTHPIHQSRIAFRDVTNRTNSRTVISSVIPPRTPLTNKAPYLVFSGWSASERSVTLGILNSLPFDWQARRYVETNMNFFILNMLCFPRWENTDWRRIGMLAAELSCVDDRFRDFAAEVGVACGPLSDAVREDKRAEIDALVAQGYGLNVDEMRFIFEDFTLDAVPQHYREQVIAKFESR